MEKVKNKILLGVALGLVGLLSFSFAHAETLKIGFVTDWEFGKQKRYTHKLPKKAKEYLNEAANYYNRNYRPDIVVGGGDYVLGNDKKKKSRKQMNEIMKVFRKINADKMYCIGNHDLRKFSKGEIENLLGIGAPHNVIDKRGFRMIVLDTNSIVSGRKKYETIGRLPPDEYAWLEEQLDADLPVIVFSHHSPIQTPEKGTYRVNLASADRVREILEKHDNVVAVISGHHAINYSTEVNGINYVIINNLTDEKAKKSYARIDVEKDESDNVKVHIEQLGKRPAVYDFEKSF